MRNEEGSIFRYGKHINVYIPILIYKYELLVKVTVI